MKTDNTNKKHGGSGQHLIKQIALGEFDGTTDSRQFEKLARWLVKIRRLNDAATRRLLSGPPDDPADRWKRGGEAEGEDDDRTFD